MRILVLTQIVPFPPDSGPKVKTYNLLRYLAQHHEVHLLSFARTTAEETAGQALRTICQSVTTVPLRRSKVRDVFYLLKSVVTNRPFLIERDDLASMRREARRLTEIHQFDAAHADQLSMAQFAVDLPVPLRVLDEHNAVWTIVRRSAAGETQPARRVLAEIEWRKLRLYEGRVCRQFDRVTVVSAEDRHDLTEAARAALNATIVPIAVDPRELTLIPRTPAGRDVLSVATMFYPPNVEGVLWFATEVFPLLRRELPRVRFRVVGSRPPPSITRLPTVEPGIEVTGYVEDLQPILQEAGVLIVPLLAGSGMRVKILEAFARGIPVVSTSIGVEGIDARAPDHLLVADTAEDFARAVARVLRDPVEARRLASAARSLVEAKYDWRTALAGLDEIYGSPDWRIDADESTSELARNARPGKGS